MDRMSKVLFVSHSLISSNLLGKLFTFRFAIMHSLRFSFLINFMSEGCELRSSSVSLALSCVELFKVEKNESLNFGKAQKEHIQSTDGLLR